jgi:biopolymer transport protein ExbB
MSAISDQVIATAPAGISIFQLLLNGGLVMIPILLLSVIAVYVFVNKFMYVSRLAKVDQSYVINILNSLDGTDVGRAIQMSKMNNTAIGRIFETGLHYIGRPVKDIEALIETATNLEIGKMEKNLSYLGIIAGIAPMLGFIGTISGVIKIFYSISMTDNISIGIIAGGLYQKMVCSGAGLIVGVLAYSFYHYLQMMIDRFTLAVQDSAFDFMKRITQP